MSTGSEFKAALILVSFSRCQWRPATTKPKKVAGSFSLVKMQIDIDSYIVVYCSTCSKRSGTFKPLRALTSTELYSSILPFIFKLNLILRKQILSTA